MIIEIMKYILYFSVLRCVLIIQIKEIIAHDENVYTKDVKSF